MKRRRQICGFRGPRLRPGPSRAGRARRGVPGIAWLLAAGLLLPGAAVPAAGSDGQATQGTIKLQNNMVSFEFATRDGSLVQITDLSTGYGWLKPSAPHRLVKLIQRTPEKSSNILFSNDSGAPEMSLSGDTLTIRFPDLRDGGANTGIRLTVTARLPGDSPEAFFKVKVENRGAYPVEEIWFPFIAGRPGRKGEDGDVFTTSKGIERDLYARFDHGNLDTHAFGEHFQRIGLSSNSLLPMMDLSAQRGGLSYIKYEKRPRPTDFVYENLTGNPEDVKLGWAWVTTILLESGRTYGSCEIGVGVHQSDWHVTADRLRRFMDTWWHPSNYPASLREKIGLYHVQIKGFNGEPYHEFDELPGMARDCRKFGVTDITFWDCSASVYCRPDPGADFWEMPADREQKLRQALKAVKGMGFQISACVNYRLINETSRAWRRIGSEAQSSFFGMPLYGNNPGSMNGAIYLNRYYEMETRSLCQGTEKFRGFARELTRQTLDLGFNSIFIDQAFDDSYALPKRHGDLDPMDAMDRTYSWFGEATRSARAMDPEAYSIAEVPDLWNTQSADVWWVWTWEQANWASSPEVFMYLMPEVRFIWATDEFQRRLLPKAFAMGAFLAVGTRGLTGLLSDEPDFSAQIGRLAKLRRQTAAFVSHGRFVDKRGLRIEGAEGYVFVSESGVAVALANGKPDRVEVTARLSPGELTDRPLDLGRVNLESGAAASVEPVSVGGEIGLNLKLDGYSAAVWTMPYSGKSTAKL